jgi:hypothetical protein
MWPNCKHPVMMFTVCSDPDCCIDSITNSGYINPESQSSKLHHGLIDIEPSNHREIQIGIPQSNFPRGVEKDLSREENRPQGPHPSSSPFPIPHRHRHRTTAQSVRGQQLIKSPKNRGCGRTWRSATTTTKPFLR